MNVPLVSIIIPVYNSQDCIAETIISAKNQTWQNKEIIIIDDGSTDESLSLAQSYSCDWIKVFHQENKGASAARNYGLREAKGDYIQFLDADDLLDANKIELQLNQIIINKGDIACGSCIHFFGTDGDFKQYHQFLNGFDFIEKPFTFIKKLYGGFSQIPASMVAIHSWLVHESIIKKAGFWNEQLSVDDDGEYFLFTKCNHLLSKKKKCQFFISSDFKKKRIYIFISCIRYQIRIFKTTLHFGRDKLHVWKILLGKGSIGLSTRFIAFQILQQNGKRIEIYGS